MSEILVIGEPEIIEGFALTGAQIRPESDPIRLERFVDQLLKSQDAGIIVVTESLFEQIPEKTRTRAEASGQPIFVTLPRPAGIEIWGEQEDLISRIIRRAIGYRLKIRR
jgi:vacuolar-type H+-ATPase subunit F/Vma7